MSNSFFCSFRFNESDLAAKLGGTFGGTEIKNALGLADLDKVQIGSGEAEKRITLNKDFH